MKASRSCNYDPGLYRRVKESVTMLQAAAFCGLKADKKGMCLCPFHHDKNPSMKIYPDGKGFYCFTCGAGGDQIGLVARFYGTNNYEAAKRLAAAFCVPVHAPETYREKREAALKRQRQQEAERFKCRALLWLRMYRILLCEARRDPGNPHFYEGIQRLDYVEYLTGCLEECQEDIRADREAVRIVGEVERRVIGWHERAGSVPAVSG